MFTKTAEFYDALYHFKDYRQACHQLQQLILEHSPHAKTLLDVACGTGKHLEYLREYFDAEGLDLNASLLEVAQKRCPGATFHQADMTAFHLPQAYDVVVCLFSSIAYVQTVDNLYKAVARMVAHVKPGGFILIEPWITPENYWVGRITANFVDKPDLKIAWMYTSQLEGLTSVFDIHYMVGTPKGVSVFNEQHVMGLWTDAQYREAFLRAGIEVSYDPKGLFGRGMYFGTKNVR